MFGRYDALASPHHLANCIWQLRQNSAPSLKAKGTQSPGDQLPKCRVARLHEAIRARGQALRIMTGGWSTKLGCNPHGSLSEMAQGDICSVHEVPIFCSRRHAGGSCFVVAAAGSRTSSSPFRDVTRVNLEVGLQDAGFAAEDNDAERGYRVYSLTYRRHCQHQSRRIPTIDALLNYFEGLK